MKFKGFFVQVILLLGCSSAFAAPGILSNKPLFLGSEVQPNILWLVDDSGSMSFEVLLSAEVATVHGNGLGPNHTNDSYYLDPWSPDNNTEKRELCVGYNVMAYDPNATYTPWVGKDKNGVSFQNLTLTTARFNPYLSNSDNYSDNYSSADDHISNNTNKVNISNHRYYRWNDDGDGIYEANECSTSDSNRVIVSNLSAENQINYANWWSYYRKREYVVKRTLSEIITDSQDRVGLATLHNNNSVGTLVRDIDNISLPLNSTADNNKNRVLERLFKIYSKNGTPLIQALNRAGEYFKVGGDDSGLFGSGDYDSPILSSSDGGQCQQNFSVLMSDGYWNGSVPNIGNHDGGISDSEFDGGSYADDYSNMLADVAMKFYETDLAPALANTVPTITGIDENKAQHMVTYTVAFGVDGTLSANPANREDAFNWPQGVADTKTAVDDMRHAAWNGRGEFLSAKNADELISSLTNAIGSIYDRKGASSAVAFNSTSLNSDTVLFQAHFDSAKWSGELTAFDFSNGVRSSSSKWQASKKLDARYLSVRPRQIITFNGNKGVPFIFPDDYTAPTADEMNSAQINDLLYNAPNAGEASYGSAIVDYLRGDRSREGSQAEASKIFRQRDSRLGDIVNSSPIYVGAPSRPYPNFIEGAENPYFTFVSDNINRNPLVYVGANDGMLHAFDGGNGEEIFSYIPELVFSSDNNAGLHYLAEKTYAHLPYVDDSPVAADVFINSSWKTYLLGGLRAGGKGIYVLDITNPSNLTESNAQSIVKMEFTHNDLGYSFSRPLVGKMNNGKWAAVFGNGYNAEPNGDGSAKLFVLYLDGSGYKLINTSAGMMVNNSCSDVGSDCNGLSTPTILDLTGDGRIDRAYAGDVQGNLWAFDLSSATDSNWGVARKDVNGVIQPLFKACSAATCTTANRQSITSAPIVKAHPNRVGRSTEPNLMVYFGTGQYLTSSDNNTTATQTMYAVWDAGDEDVDALDRTDLQVQIISRSATVTGARDLTSNSVNYTLSGEMGWYIDLGLLSGDAGERIVVEPAVIGDIVFFNSMVPDDAACAGGGRGYLMFADSISGGKPDFSVMDINNDKVINSADLAAGMELSGVPSSSRFIGNKDVLSDSNGTLSILDFEASKAKPSSRSTWSITQ